MFDMIANNTADITCLSQELSNEYFKIGDPTLPICEDFPIFILPKRGGVATDGSLLFKTFHWTIWLTCLSLAVGVLFNFHLHFLLHRRSNIKNHTMGREGKILPHKVGPA